MQDVESREWGLLLMDEVTLHSYIHIYIYICIYMYVCMCVCIYIDIDRSLYRSI